MTPELRPAAVAALRRHRWAGVGLAVIGVLLAVGMPVLIVLLAQKQVNEGGGGAALGGGPAGVVAVGVWMAWQGLVVYPQENRAMRSEGRRVELRPVFATGSRSGSTPGKKYEIPLAWLVADDPTGGPALAIPVEPKLAERALEGTAALVRGRFELDGRVVLDFPHEVAFPLGRVEAVPAGLPERARVEQVRPRGGRPSKGSIVWRLGLAAGLVFLGGSALVASIEADGQPCGSLAEALSDPPFEGCAGEAGINLFGAVVCLGGAGYLLWRCVQRRRRRSDWLGDTEPPA